ncbi:MAG: VacJ family lipoprotein [Rickettsiales bacterium]
MKILTRLVITAITAIVFPGFVANTQESPHENEQVATHQEVPIKETDAKFTDFNDSDFKDYELPNAQAATIEDPIEPFNRAMFAFNKGLDTIALNPLAHTYRAIVPNYGRDRIDDVLANLREPVNMANSILQGDPDKAGRAMGRFLINTILGVGGLVDVATEAGVAQVNEDFGKTLGYYGVDTGPYLVLPILGPSSARDFPSLGMDVVMDPYTWLAPTDASYIRSGVKLLDMKESLLDPASDIERTSLDEYATYRSIYAQKRKFKDNTNLGN